MRSREKFRKVSQSPCLRTGRLNFAHTMSEHIKNNQPPLLLIFTGPILSRTNSYLENAGYLALFEEGERPGDVLVGPPLLPVPAVGDSLG